MKEKVVNVEEGPDENPNVDALFEELGGYKEMVTLDDFDLLVLTEMSPEKTNARKTVSFNPTVVQQDFDPEICDLDERNRLVKDLDEMVKNRKRINLEIQELLAMETSKEPDPKKMKMSPPAVLGSSEKTTEENLTVSFIFLTNQNSTFLFLGRGGQSS